MFLAHITAEKTYSVKKIVLDPQIPDSRYFLSSQIPDILGFNSQIPDFLGFYSLIPDADPPQYSLHYGIMTLFYIISILTNVDAILYVFLYYYTYNLGRVLSCFDIYN